MEETTTAPEETTIETPETTTAPEETTEAVSDMPAGVPPEYFDDFV